MFAKIAGVIALTLVALIVGAFGIAIFIGVGEASNNAIAAFAAVSFPFALLAGFLSWLSPRAQWPVAVAMATPVTLLCMIGAQMGSIYLPGAIWTAFCTIAGARMGARLKHNTPEAAS
jgi:hypothetical protein